MKNGMKKLVSVAIASLMAAAMSVSVFAADYATAPIHSESVQSTSVVTSAIKDAVKNADQGSDAEGGAVATVEVKSTNNLPISATVMKDLAKTGGKLVIVSPNATITVDGSTITSVKKINLSVKVTNTANKSVVKTKAKGSLGCTVSIAVTSNKMSAEKLESAKVYDGDTSIGDVSVSEDGVPVISVSKGGTYTIK